MIPPTNPTVHIRRTWGRADVAIVLLESLPIAPFECKGSTHSGDHEQCRESPLMHPMQEHAR